MDGQRQRQIRQMIDKIHDGWIDEIDGRQVIDKIDDGQIRQMIDKQIDDR